MENGGASGDEVPRIYVFVVLIMRPTRCAVPDTTSRQRRSRHQLGYEMLHHRRTDWQKSLQNKSWFRPGDVSSLRVHHQDDTLFQRNQMIEGHGEMQVLLRL